MSPFVDKGIIDFSEGGPCYVEVQSPVGIITFVYHPQHRPPFRLYGPDGMEVDPRIMPVCPHQSVAGYDLSHFASSEWEE